MFVKPLILKREEEKRFLACKRGKKETISLFGKKREKKGAAAFSRKKEGNSLSGQPEKLAVWEKKTNLFLKKNSTRGTGGGRRRFTFSSISRAGRSSQLNG